MVVFRFLCDIRSRHRKIAGIDVSTLKMGQLFLRGGLVVGPTHTYYLCFFRKKNKNKKFLFFIAKNIILNKHSSYLDIILI